MRKGLQEIRYFFYSQAVADGFRTTVAILLPALAGLYGGWFEAGLAMASGALCVSLTDAPGPLLNKRNGMLICALLLFFITALTALVRVNIYLLGMEIALVAFFFSMFNVYGARAAGVGNACLLMMILTMDKHIPAEAVLPHSIQVMAGGLCYLLISIVASLLQPYRAGQRILGESIRELAGYLSTKASFYDPATDLQANYQQLVGKQIIVHEKQDAVRDILFKTPRIVREQTENGRKLVNVFVETVDLFEDITAAYYDYALLRKRFEKTGILEKIAGQIMLISTELDRLGMAIQMNRHFSPAINFEERLAVLKREIDGLPKTSTESHLVLKKILVNLRRLVQRYEELYRYFDKQICSQSREPIDHSQFVTHQPLDANIFWSNLTMTSTVFRHALRVAIACEIGYLLTKTISYGQYSYWILLTIAFILKPAFSLTKERNIQRIIGTFAGGLLGVLILLLIPVTEVQFAFMVLFMFLTYTFLRVNYLAMVLFTTPFVLILFSFLGVGFIDLAKERVFDTVLGCAIAFATGTFLFPSWESESIKTHLQNMLKANRDYLQLIRDGLTGKTPDLLRYKLVRKEVYVSTANLSAAFRRMSSEPLHTQRHSKAVHQAIVQNHILFSNIATIATQLRRREPRSYPELFVGMVTASIRKLEEGRDALALEPFIIQKRSLIPISEHTAENASMDDLLLKDQLEFVCKVSSDIQQTVLSIAG
jgi:uncharacterized membrane protein (TIGR01666 family)